MDSSNNGYQGDPVFDRPDLGNLEHQAKSLMNEIFEGCQELQTLNNQISWPKSEPLQTETYEAMMDNLTGAAQTNQQDNIILSKQLDAIRERIFSLCRDLEKIKETLMQAMQAMEGNAQKLESQNLHTQAAELNLQRAAEIARVEVERLERFIDEIDETLSQANEVLSVPTRQLQKPPYPTDDLRLNKEQPQIPNLEQILAGFENAQRIPLENRSFDVSIPPTFGHEAPMLGGAQSPGLEGTLSKVPTPSFPIVKIHADPYTGELYKDDVYSGRMELSYDPYDPIAGPMAIGSQYEPLMAQAGFDGSYLSHCPGGVIASFDADAI